MPHTKTQAALASRNSHRHQTERFSQFDGERREKYQLENHTSESIAPLFASPSLYKEKLRLNENVL
jgi:hypothetical protein